MKSDPDFNLLLLHSHAIIMCYISIFNFGNQMYSTWSESHARINIWTPLKLVNLSSSFILSTKGLMTHTL